MSCFALTQGREVFAIPGQINSNSSFGVNELIKQGAKLVTNTDEILEEFIGYSCRRERFLPKEEKAIDPVLSGAESKIYRLVSSEPVHIDEFIEKTNLDITCVSDILLSLRLKKLIKEIPGKRYIRWFPASPTRRDYTCL